MYSAEGQIDWKNTQQENILAVYQKIRKKKKKENSYRIIFNNVIV